MARKQSSETSEIYSPIFYLDFFPQHKKYFNGLNLVKLPSFTLGQVLQPLSVDCSALNPLLFFPLESEGFVASTNIIILVYFLILPWDLYGSVV